MTENINRKVNGYRNSSEYIINDEQIEMLKADIISLNADLSVFRFNEGNRTGFDDLDVMINLRGDVFPDQSSDHPRDRMSAKAVIAHEYYGHYKFFPSSFPIGDWRDEMRASYTAALTAPNLSAQDRAYLISDAYERAKEAGNVFKFSNIAREIIYGYNDEELQQR